MKYKNLKIPPVPASTIEMEHFREYVQTAMKNGLSAEQILNGKHAEDVKKLHPSLYCKMEDEVYIAFAEAEAQF